MIVLVSGSTGLVGKSLIDTLARDGHAVRRLRRGPTETIQDGDVVWNPLKGEILSGALAGVEAVVHLAGESIAAGRWTKAKKNRIRESRVADTQALVRLLSSLPVPPKILISASAIGYYGDRGSESLTEESAPGSGFLPEVCRAWEAAANPLREKEVRVVHLRFGVILSGRGGALKAMLPPFKMGVGGRIGTGEQYMSWIGLADVVRIVQRTLADEDLTGPVNVVSPQPVTNKEFTAALGRALARPTIFPLPAFAARLVLGEMADALLLASARVVPQKLLDRGYTFVHADLDGALRAALAD